MVDEDETAGKAPRKPPAHKLVAGAPRSLARKIARTFERDLRFDENTPDSLRLLVGQAARAIAEATELADEAKKVGLATVRGVALLKDASRLRKEGAALYADAVDTVASFPTLLYMAEGSPEPKPEQKRKELQHREEPKYGWPRKP